MKLPTASEYAAYIAGIKNCLAQQNSDRDLFEAIVNAPFDDRLTAVRYDLGIVVLLLVNTQTQTIDRIALSDTELAKEAVKISIKPFKAIKIPIGYPTNIIAQAIGTNQPQITNDWEFLFVPALPPDAARFNQAGAGIGCSVVYPVVARDGAALIFSYFQLPDAITKKHHTFMQEYAQLVTQALSSKR